VALPRLGDEFTQVRLSRDQRINHSLTVTLCPSGSGLNTPDQVAPGTAGTTRGSGRCITPQSCQAHPDATDTRDEHGDNSEPPVTKPRATPESATKLLARRLLAVAAIAVILPATMLIAGCGATPAKALPHATTESCFAFGVHALRRHETVTRL